MPTNWTNDPSQRWHSSVKHCRGAIIMHDGARWRVIDREWDRQSKDWYYRIYPDSEIAT